MARSSRVSRGVVRSGGIEGIEYLTDSHTTFIILGILGIVSFAVVIFCILYKFWTMKKLRENRSKNNWIITDHNIKPIKNRPGFFQRVNVFKKKKVTHSSEETSQKLDSDGNLQHKSQNETVSRHENTTEDNNHRGDNESIKDGKLITSNTGSGYNEDDEEGLVKDNEENDCKTPKTGSDKKSSDASHGKESEIEIQKQNSADHESTIAGGSKQVGQQFSENDLENEDNDFAYLNDNWKPKKNSTDDNENESSHIEMNRKEGVKYSKLRRSRLTTYNTYFTENGLNK